MGGDFPCRKRRPRRSAKKNRMVIAMSGFKIEKDNDKISSINRTIRFKPEVFDKIVSLSAKTGVSFNKICAQCIAYALENLDGEELG